MQMARATAGMSMTDQISRSSSVFTATHTQQRGDTSSHGSVRKASFFARCALQLDTCAHLSMQHDCSDESMRMLALLQKQSVRASCSLAADLHEYSTANSFALDVISAFNSAWSFAACLNRIHILNAERAPVAKDRSLMPMRRVIAKRKSLAVACRSA